MNYRSRKLKMLICGCILMLLLGSVFSWSVFKKPLQAAFAWDDSQLSWPFVICMICFTLGNITSAKAQKYVSQRIIIWLSGVIASAGLIMASRTTAPWQLNIAYGVCMGTAVGMSYNCIVSSGGAWYADKSGTITGISMMAFGCGSLIFAPLDNYMLANFGWQNTFIYLGIIFAAVAGVCGLFISMPPKDYSCPQPEKKLSTFSGLELNTAQMIRRPSFWLLLAWSSSGAVIGYSVINQVFMISSSIGISDVASSLAVSLVSVGTGLSRVISGKIFDTKGGAWEMGIISVLLVISMLLLLPAIKLGSHVLLFVGMGIFGLGFGGASPTIANFTRAFYGSENFASNYSVMNCNALIGSILSQFVSGYVLDISGSYFVMMLIVAFVVLVSVSLNLMLKRP